MFEVIQRGRSLRAKGTQLLHGSFLLFNPAHLCRTGSPVQKCCQLIELIGRTGGVNLYPAIVLITDPASYTNITGVRLDEPAISHSLHAA
jgi:hypothetical protein